MNEITRPSQYESSVRAKESAREEIEVARNERPRLLTEAQTKKREEETQAQITVDRAESQARIMETKYVGWKLNLCGIRCGGMYSLCQKKCTIRIVPSTPKCQRRPTIYLVHYLC